MMCGPVLTHEACPINGQGDVQALQGYIVYQLIVAALQKGRVNGEHRFETIAGHTRSQRHRVLFGNRDIVEALGKRLGILHHARPLTHGGGNAHHPVILCCEVAQPLPEDVLILGCFGFGWHSRLCRLGRFQFVDCVVADGVSLRRSKTLSFDGANVQELRTFEVSHDLERIHQLRQIMAI